MATKYYGINDKWTDDDLVNVIEVASEDGTVSSVKVNGEEYGGGGGGTYPTITAVDTGGAYEYSCDWSYALLEAKISEDETCAGIIIDTSGIGSMGGTWSAVSETKLHFVVNDFGDLYYNTNGTITES